MVDNLDDCEFWLPSQFLTDDDILMDFHFDTSSKLGSMISTTASNSDLSTETESDEDDFLLAGITHQISRSNLHYSSCSLHSKGWKLSSSPQSTLWGCTCICNQSSSRESGSCPVSPPQQQPPTEDKNDADLEDNKKNKNENATLDLLNKAAGEVARLKMRTEKSIGTGFFDCSQKGVSYPPPLKNLDPIPRLYFQPQFLHFPPMGWAPSNGMQFNQQPKQQPPQNRATKNIKSNTNINNNRPLGLPPSAWPPLQAQSQAQKQDQGQAHTQGQPHAQSLPPRFVVPKREYAGTGVFLPRCVTSPSNETRKKSDGNTSNKSKSGKGSQSQLNNHRRNSGKTTTTTTMTSTTTPVTHIDIQLPQEWTY